MRSSFVSIAAAQIVFISLTIGCYTTNIVRFCKCDFEPSYKAEIIYGVGILVPTFYVTAFMDFEK